MVAKKSKDSNEERIKKLAGPICAKHKPMNKKLGYVAWHEWADKKAKKGHTQK